MTHAVGSTLVLACSMAACGSTTIRSRPSSPLASLRFGRRVTSSSTRALARSARGGWPIGEQERFEATSDGLLAHRSGLVTIDDTFRIDPSTCAHERLRHVDTGDEMPLRIDAIEARSADGTSVPIEVLRRADVALDGTAPPWVYGYGGFRYSQFLPFQAIVRAWVERGGIDAVIHARGGLGLGQTGTMTASGRPSRGSSSEPTPKKEALQKVADRPTPRAPTVMRIFPGARSCRASRMIM